MSSVKPGHTCTYTQKYRGRCFKCTFYAVVISLSQKFRLQTTLKAVFFYSLLCMISQRAGLANTVTSGKALASQKKTGLKGENLKQLVSPWE